MKFLSWNVNGFRACLRKGFSRAFEEQRADIFAIQETKMQEGQAPFEPEGYLSFFHSAERKGYAGTAVFTRREPLSVRKGIGIPAYDAEGRVLTLEYDGFYLVNVYVPNSQRELARLPFRMQWEDDFRAYLTDLDARKPVVCCGDLNVAHEEIDLRRPKANRLSAGFTDQERERFSLLLASGFTDTFRALHPDRVAYTWWSYMHHARETDTGWRIDYFLVSNRLLGRVRESVVLADVLGSDHCPVGLLADL